MELASMTCTPNIEGISPLTRKEVFDLRHEVAGWSLADGRLTRRFALKSFQECLDFIGEIAGLAAQQGHFPDIAITEQRYVEIAWYSYACGGLTLNDFIMAAKINSRAFTRSGMQI
ncbi:MAG TPA: 4a-hydroxytetrahydrobiopterin dehydratase [Methanoculleus sp.]|nr:4a-hydroxytetrahydrobiopterin dehydratase [Methanoculleus sp.]